MNINEILQSFYLLFHVKLPFELIWNALSQTDFLCTTQRYNHMHMHVDRDNFVKIYLENVEPQYRFAFKKVDGSLFDNFGTPYDRKYLKAFVVYLFYSRNSF
jgi:Astacin (Peptidase family M12A)